jgi:hypothetical protein
MRRMSTRILLNPVREELEPLCRIVGQSFAEPPLVFTYLFVSISYSASLPTQSVSVRQHEEKGKIIFLARNELVDS